MRPLRKQILNQGLHHFLSLSFWVALGTHPLLANASSRLSGSFGYTSATVNSGGGPLTESPYGFSFGYENILSSRSTLGFEHLRTLSRDQGTWSTAVSQTGLKYKYFPLAPVSPWNEGSELSNYSYLRSVDLSPFVGVGSGFAQSSLRDRIGGVQARGTAGVYLAFYGGIELPLGGRWGLSFEGMYSRQVFGSGEVGLQSGLLSLFIYF